MGKKKGPVRRPPKIKNGLIAQKEAERRAREAYAEVFKDIYMDTACKIVLVTMNQVFGIGTERAERFWKAFEENQAEFAKWAKEVDYDYALSQLNTAVGQVLGDHSLEVNLRF